MPQERTVNTKKKILNSAKKVFLKHGFEGGSISQIAKGAGVPNSLIFHHFESKAKLWTEVKTSIKAKIKTENPHFDILPPTLEINLKAVIKKMIHEPLHTLKNHPQLARLYKWEILEDEPTALWTYKVFTLGQLKPIFNELRKKGELDPTLSDDFLEYFLFSQTTAVLMHEFLPHVDLDVYIEQLAARIEIMLKPQ